MAERKSFDVVVIGGGPGGYVAGIRAAQLGLRTAVVERERLGGICLNWGCIPSKALLANARIFNEIRHADRWGIRVGNPEFDMSKIIARSQEVADQLSKGIAFLMKKNRIEVLEGTARLAGPGKILVSKANENTTVESSHIIIATGARPRSLPGIRVDGKKVITSREGLLLDRVPPSIVIIGAGAIGVEFAYFYNTFGSRVTVVEMLDQLLPLEDVETAQELARSFKKNRIEVMLQTKVIEVKAGQNGIVAVLETQSQQQKEVSADMALNAVGVVANTEELNLEAAGVKLEKGFIRVDSWYQTSAPGIYAIGDVIGPPLLAHVASHEGIVCVEKIANHETHPVNYQNVPNCTYCQPQVASVGLTEKQAREQGYSLKIGKFPFQALGKARATQSTQGFVKLIFDENYGELLGAHLIGEEATEMIAELVVAKSLGSTYKELLKAVHAHPTFSEAVMEAAGMAYGEQIHL